MNPEDWKPKQRIEQRYAQELLSLLKKYFAGGISVSQVTLNEFFRLYAEQAARRMVVGLLVESARNWRQAARESMRGRLIYESLLAELRGPMGKRFNQIVYQNAELISSLPLTISRQVTKYMATNFVSGQRAASAESELAKKYASHLASWHVKLIARTETSKASTALTRARAEQLSLDWYVWETSQDQRVRFAHRKMQGILCNWNEPPAPELLVGEKSQGHYAPGDIYNCRCYPAPLLRFNQIKWPHRIHYAGRVQYMTLNQFRSITNLPLAA